MTRTNRNFPENGRFYRRPKTTNEIKQNKQLKADIRADDIPYKIDKLNRIHRFIPNAWDDIFVSMFRKKR